MRRVYMYRGLLVTALEVRGDDCGARGLLGHRGAVCRRHRVRNLRGGDDQLRRYPRRPRL